MATKKILGYCTLCGKAIYEGDAFDLKQIQGSMKAVCKAGCSTSNHVHKSR